MLVASRSKSPLFVFLCLALLLQDIAPFFAAAGAGVSDGVELPTGEDIATFLQEGDNWQWPPEGKAERSSLMQNMLASWCGETYKDAVSDASEKAVQFERLREERDAKYSDWMKCQVERGSQESELAREFLRQQQIHNASYEHQRAVMAAQWERESAHHRADVEACELKAKRCVESACDRDVSESTAGKDLEVKTALADLAACEAKGGGAGGGRCAELEVGVVRIEEDRKVWEGERAKLRADVQECRPARAAAEERLKGVLADGTIASLESTVTWLQMLLLVTAVLAACGGGGAVFLFRQEGGLSSTSTLPGASFLLPPPPSTLRLLPPDKAREEFEATYGGGGRRGGTAAWGGGAILTASGEADGVAYLLVPVNVASSRRFSLFGSGGDYTTHLEKAQELVAQLVPNTRLAVVLYETGGCLFTETTLQNLRLTADKVADEAVPRDSEFPSYQDVVALWLFQAEGLSVACSEGASDLAGGIKSQPWAQFLLERSGRYGPLPPL